MNGYSPVGAVNSRKIIRFGPASDSVCGVAQQKYTHRIAHGARESRRSWNGKKCYVCASAISRHNINGNRAADKENS